MNGFVSFYQYGGLNVFDILRSSSFINESPSSKLFAIINSHDLPFGREQPYFVMRCVACIEGWYLLSFF
jgi:hypothetical protein